MNGYRAFVKKEWMENTRNYRLLIMLALFLVFGLLSPFTAKFMPELLAALASDMQITLAEPAAVDSWAQFYKNVSSLGLSLVIILFSTCLSGEYVKGTLTIMLTKGLSRPAIVLSKFSVMVAIMSISYWLCFGVTYGYTAYFWRGEALPHTVFAAFALWLAGVMYLSILMLGCVLFRQAFTAILFFLGINTAISLVGMIKQIKVCSPLILTSKNVDLLSGTVTGGEFVVPIVITLIIIVGALAAAVVLFNKKQL